MTFLTCRALDLTDEKGFLGGKILADLGVDVIKVERPGGDPSRNKGPFWHNLPDPQKSLYWLAYNNNKKGITLDITSRQGQDIFKSLAKKIDFVLESFQPGYLDSIGLGYSTLSQINPGIIMVSISYFGQAGPYRDYVGSDMIAMAMSGLLYQTGEPDRPPVNISVPQACMHAGADAAVGAMIAYYHRQATGKGQQVDISLQQSVAYFLANAIPFWELRKIILQRSGQYRSGVSTTTLQRQVWQCQDGYIFFLLIPGKTGGKAYKALLEWMKSEGMSDPEAEKIDWVNMDMATITQKTVDTITFPIQRFFLTHTKKEILEQALARSISLCPLSSMGELLDDSHLKARQFWTDIKHDELDSSLIYPREFVKSSEESCETRFRAPLAGEHNRAIYQEVGISEEQLVMLKQAGII
ncbi:MAG: putative acyl-CoA transferase/carnitine dehydratase [Chloroflexi bacterium]|nr:putative acyl-CoA transferase/carnitine dehydratase [Chloroflexota bacterium]